MFGDRKIRFVGRLLNNRLGDLALQGSILEGRFFILFVLAVLLAGQFFAQVQGLG